MIEVRRAELPRDLRPFLKVAAPIYAGDPYWVPPLRFERRAFFDPAINPYFRFADTQAFVAWRGHTPVGRIVATLDHNLQEREPGVGFFGFFEFPDDGETGPALFEAACRWLADEHGVHTVRGPYSFNQNHEFGLRVERFDSFVTFGTPHNPAYYERVYASLGLRGVMDWYGYWFGPMEPPETMVKIDGWLRRRHDIQLVGMGTDFEPQIEQFWEIVGAALADNWGRSFVERDEFEYRARGLRRVVDPRLSYFLYLDGEIAAASLTLPDLNQLFSKLGGRLLPFRWRHLIWPSRHFTRARALLVGVLPKYQRLPLGVPLYLATGRALREMGMEGVEVSAILDNNHRMRGALEKLGGEIRITWRAFEKSLG